MVFKNDKKCFFMDCVRDHGATMYFCFLTRTPCHYRSNISLCDTAVPNYVIAERLCDLLGCRDFSSELGD